MVNTRRSELDIINDILGLSKDGAKKTEILYQGNLSYTQLQSYLSFLLEKKMLEEHEVTNNGNFCIMYKTTDKGLYLLEDIKRVLNHLD